MKLTQILNNPKKSIKESNLPPGYEPNENQFMDDVNDEILLLRKEIPPDEFKNFWAVWHKGDFDDLISDMQSSGEELPDAAGVARMLYDRFRGGDEEQIQEDNVTANLDGGKGQPKTPFAFGKKGSTKGVSIGKASKSFTEPAKETHRWGKNFESLMVLSGRTQLDEASYRAFKANEGSEKSKINLAIREAYQRILEAEKLISNASKLKLEVGANQGVFWKQTGVKFQKLAERLTRLGTTLREFNK